MHYFVLNLDGFSKDEVFNFLKSKSNKKYVHLTELVHGRRTCYDFVEAFECLKPSFVDVSDTFYFATANFESDAHLTFFRLKFPDCIVFHTEAEQADFLNRYQKSLMYEIRKLTTYTSIHRTTRDQELSTLRDELLKTFSNAKGSRQKF